MVLHGGNDQLPKAFATRLGNHISYRCAVVKLEQDNNKVRVTFLKAGVQQQVEADRVIVAIPFSVLRKIELDNSFSPQKRKAISELRYEDITEVFLQSKSRFWSEQGIDGTAMTDLPISLVVDHTATQAGQRGILQSQTEHKMARQVLLLDASCELWYYICIVVMEVPVESAITVKGQATIPKAIREHLGLKPGDRVKFFVHPDGSVVLLPKLSASSLRGIVKSRRRRPVTIAEMTEAAIEGAARVARPTTHR
jgi:AbrB family looped-hinge helix DNA binding protein